MLGNRRRDRTADGRVTYRIDQEVRKNRIERVRIAANQTLVSGHLQRDFSITRDALKIAYRAAQELRDIFLQPGNRRRTLQVRDGDQTFHIAAQTVTVANQVVGELRPGRKPRPPPSVALFRRSTSEQHCWRAIPPPGLVHCESIKSIDGGGVADLLPLLVNLIVKRQRLPIPMSPHAAAAVRVQAHDDAMSERRSYFLKSIAVVARDTGFAANPQESPFVDSDGAHARLRQTLAATDMLEAVKWIGFGAAGATGQQENDTQRTQISC